MTRRQLAAIMAVLCCALLALACSSGGDSTAGEVEEKTTPQAVPPISPPPSTDPAMASALAENGIPPSPDVSTQRAYLEALIAINPAIVGKKAADTIVDRGRNQCGSISKYPNDRAKLVELTNSRFSAPEAPNGFGLPTAEKILDVVHEHLCPTYPMAKA
ncbi:hypothetical protein GCM10009557_05980 [Virgisporangium ochraceum]|uniref:DUF732 domain-containing protein n=1 Tax=Virgisporangium ochraceum TaxID=65505 RepID=A0A8J3ZQ67_9ACTN|nr:hypothetical protein [Virgisporangium ochraceum]GIJ66255.1 hypothetical protein Voc01_011720 [Virgisporangium ochraceum]